MENGFIKIANTLISAIVALCLCICGVYAIYALWDNNRIYSAAEEVQQNIQALKPKPNQNKPSQPVEEASSRPEQSDTPSQGEQSTPSQGEQSQGDSDFGSFTELKAINKDIGAWLTVYNTNIDYPVVQGETNLSYINKDIYGNFALAGSIYLDSRNRADYSDPYSLLYGHHMEKNAMFGNLDLFKDKAFFDKSTSGELMLPSGDYELHIFSCMIVRASDKFIFEPQRWRTEKTSALLDYIAANSLYLRSSVIDELRADPSLRILALSTCSSEFTDARTIVLAVIK